MNINGKLIQASFVGVALLGVVLFPGCSGPTSKIIGGNVTVADKTPDGGEVRFVPIDGTTGPVSASAITEGRYRMEAHDGVLFGKYRVEINATKKTGRQVMQHNGFEMAMSDEIVPIAPPQYSSKESPLRIEITADSDEKFDITIE